MRKNHQVWWASGGEGKRVGVGGTIENETERAPAAAANVKNAANLPIPHCTHMYLYIYINI